MTGHLLELRAVVAGYGGVPVLRDVDLALAPGEVVALLGANGAGKTTTMLTIAGLLPLQAGNVFYRGEPLRGPLQRRARRGIALVTADRALFPGLSVADNLRLGRGGIHAALEYFPELESLLGRKAGLLSGGEQQMLSVARALASRPDLLLVDELSLGLAPMIVDRLLIRIEAIAADGTGVLLVEQHARKALGVAQRAYVLCRGAVDLCGDATELLERFNEVERAYLCAPA
jgi:branched-chain amino acid transport system ATP-binding protein